MTPEAFKTWLDAYGRAWETQDALSVVKLFSEDATYQETPFAAPLRGRDAIRDYWNNAVVRTQEGINFGCQILALAGDIGIAHWWASFVRVASKSRVKLDGVFLLSFTPDQLCRELREWWVRQEPAR